MSSHPRRSSVIERHQRWLQGETSRPECAWWTQKEINMIQSREFGGGPIPSSLYSFFLLHYFVGCHLCCRSVVEYCRRWTLSHTHHTWVLLRKWSLSEEHQWKEAEAMPTGQHGVSLPSSPPIPLNRTTSATGAPWQGPPWLMLHSAAARGHDLSVATQNLSLYLYLETQTAFWDIVTKSEITGQLATINSSVWYARDIWNCDLSCCLMCDC